MLTRSPIALAVASRGHHTSTDRLVVQDFQQEEFVNFLGAGTITDEGADGAEILGERGDAPRLTGRYDHRTRLGTGLSADSRQATRDGSYGSRSHGGCGDAAQEGRLRDSLQRITHFWGEACRVSILS